MKKTIVILASLLCTSLFAQPCKTLAHFPADKDFFLQELAYDDDGEGYDHYQGPYMLRVDGTTVKITSRRYSNYRLSGDSVFSERDFEIKELESLTFANGESVFPKREEAASLEFKKIEEIAPWIDSIGTDMNGFTYYVWGISGSTVMVKNNANDKKIMFDIPPEEMNRIIIIPYEELYAGRTNPHDPTEVGLYPIGVTKEGHLLFLAGGKEGSGYDLKILENTWKSELLD